MASNISTILTPTNQTVHGVGWGSRCYLHGEPVLTTNQRPSEKGDKTRDEQAQWGMAA